MSNKLTLTPASKLAARSTMLIVSGKLYVDHRTRDELVAAHQEMVARARKQPGCLDLVIGADPLEPDRINLFEHWESEQHLADWRKIANPPELEFDRKRANVQKHQISSSAPPF